MPSRQTVETISGEVVSVAREVRRGWRLGDEVLRPAQVVMPAAERESGEPWP